MRKTYSTGMAKPHDCNYYPDYFQNGLMAILNLIGLFLLAVRWLS